MKKGKIFLGICLLFVTILAATACAKKSDSSTDVAYESSTSKSGATSEENQMYSTFTTAETSANGTEDTASAPEAADDSSSDGGLASTSALSSDTLQVQSQEKIIQNFYLDVETQDFDTLITDLENKIQSLGGYEESSQIGGKSYYDSNITRTGNIVARIPSDKVSQFLSNVKEAANVVDSQKTSENVSLEYIDTESRIEALKIEQERLFAILEKADDLENIITLESRLSDIRYELQNYESQLRSYDDKVEFSTVTMNIQEVTRITPVEEKKPSFASRIKNGFSDTVYNISQGFMNFLVWFIVNLPYLLIWGVIIFVAVLIIRKALRKYYGIKGDTAATISHPQNQNSQNQDQNQK